MKAKNRSHRCNINRTMSRNGHKYSKYRTCTKQHLSKFEAQFRKKLCNTEAELKRCIAYKNVCNSLISKIYFTEFHHIFAFPK